MFRVPVYYSPEMVSFPPGFFPSPRKPAPVVQRWIDDAMPIEVRPVVPVTVAELERVHDARMVAEILACRRNNGFGERSAEVAATLPYTSGAMVQAAHEALRNGRCAVAPASGYHHAGFAFCGGFCTFNGLMVAAASLRAAHPEIRVGILDCDFHDGNGTRDVINRLGADWVVHYTAGEHGYGIEDARRFLALLPEVLRDMKQRGCAVVLYQAGADPHVDDPLGGFLTDEELEERDRIVFETCRALRLPIAWDLAGGYRVDADNEAGPVIDVHARTMQACAATFASTASVAVNDDAEET